MGVGTEACLEKVEKRVEPEEIKDGSCGRENSGPPGMSTGANPRACDYVPLAVKVTSHLMTLGSGDGGG